MQRLIGLTNADTSGVNDNFFEVFFFSDDWFTAADNWTQVLITNTSNNVLRQAVFKLFTPSAGGVPNTTKVYDYAHGFDSVAIRNRSLWLLKLLLDMQATLPISTLRDIAASGSSNFAAQAADMTTTRASVCQQEITRLLPDLVAHLWASVNQNSTGGGAAASRAFSIQADVRKAFRSQLQANDWLSSETKTIALKKLDDITAFIGFAPETPWLADYDQLQIDSEISFAENLLRLRRFRWGVELARVDTAVDNSRRALDQPFSPWDTVNAYYSPDTNSINVFAVTLQPNWFSADWLDLLNVARMGFILGHELTHGFDNIGHQYNPAGEYAPWFSPSDEAGFNKRSQCFVDQFEEDWLSPWPAFNGSYAVGEIVADSGGLQFSFATAMAAASQGDNDLIQAMFDKHQVNVEQAFFYSWASHWCESTLPSVAAFNAQGVHPSSKARINGAAANFKPFADAFQCKADSRMVNPSPCKVW
jgi:hypothetical protein